VEFYHIWDRPDTFDQLKKFLGQFHKVALPDFEKSLYFHQDLNAVRHLFRVTSGLDSMVMGETEILGQVKKAYQLASSMKSTGPILNALFQRSFYVAKLLQSATKVYEGSLSVSSVAVQLAEKIFGDLSSKVVLLVGAGKMSEQTVQRLVERGVRGIIASNRSYEKAQNLAEKFGGKSIRFDDIQQVSSQVDIIISSTAAPHFILHKENVSRLMQERRQRPLFIIDIAVPRDVDPEVNTLDNVYLYNIDDLKGIADKNLEERLKDRQKADEIVESEVGRFMNWYQSLGIRPTIQKLQEKFEKIRLEELQKTREYLKDLNETQWSQIDYLTQRVIKNILHEPLTQLKENVDGKYMLNLSQVLKDLFRLEEYQK
jgi:glutamyl-tRNA reductase